MNQQFTVYAYHDKTNPYCLFNPVKTIEANSLEEAYVKAFSIKQILAEAESMNAEAFSIVPKEDDSKLFENKKNFNQLLYIQCRAVPDEMFTDVSEYFDNDLTVHRYHDHDNVFILKVTSNHQNDTEIFVVKYESDDPTDFSVVNI